LRFRGYKFLLPLHRGNAAANQIAVAVLVNVAAANQNVAAAKQYVPGGEVKHNSQFLEDARTIICYP
jgi:hypothetical protein